MINHKTDVFNKIIGLYLVIGFAILVGSRPEGFDPDWDNYLYYFKNLDRKNFEIGFQYFIRISRLFAPPEGVFVIASIFTYFTLYVSLDGKLFFQRFFFVLLFLTPFAILIQIRFGIAVSLFLLSLYYVNQNKYFVFIILCIFTVLIHSSFVVFFALYIFAKRVWRLSNIIALFSVIIYLLDLKLLNILAYVNNYLVLLDPRFNVYLSISREINLFSRFNIITIFLIFCISYMLLGRLYKKNVRDLKSEGIILIFCSLSLILFQNVPIVGLRFAYVTFALIGFLGASTRLFNRVERRVLISFGLLFFGRSFINTSLYDYSFFIEIFS